ncbi:aspartate kinase [Lactovum miscens]|uniref:Aspartokinase n=1 Tax=Lactovum miscens TaxID=190387 RepID=A0A841CAV4_9LACT|nr:aspartate kinase [Lactovum miscens]MBB5888692.1 aspartate kinase [Lactovum miscens]
MKLAKFGGSSLASGEQIRKVFGIVKSDPLRKIVVVSAPGKRFESDIKVTDLLDAYYQDYKNGKNLVPIQTTLLDRFEEICDELELSELKQFLSEKVISLALLNLHNRFVYDKFLSTGEECSALIVSSYFKKNGLNAKFLSPKDAGILVSSDPCEAKLLPIAYNKIAGLVKYPEILIIPGFYGATLNGEVCTFSRGGSDITGAILAAGVKAEMYENFTDVDGIYSVNPNVVENPVIIEEVTYREMRELSFAGFSVLHEEALIPAARAGVPMLLKNTNHPELPGTQIVPNWTIDMPVVGIASSRGYVIIKITKYMLYRDISFGRRFFEILEKLGIRFEAITTGIDDMSILVRDKYLSAPIQEALSDDLKEILQVDDIVIVKNLAVVTAVSEEIRQQTHITGRATLALARKNIKIETLMQGASEVSLLFIVKEEVENETVRSLYEEFFED